MTTATKAKPAEEETKGLGLSPTQVVAGAGASVTSTVLASTTGTAGTLIGAGVGSIVSTVAAALYTHSLNRGKDKITKVIPVGTPAGATAVPGRDDTKVLPAHLDPRKSKTGRFDIKLDRKFWTKIALFAAGMFVVVMGAITAFEFMTQKPVSALVGDTQTTRSTTLGAVTDRSPSTTTPEDPQQQEDSPVTTTTEPDDDSTTEQTTAPEPQDEDTPEQGTDVQRTAEDTAGTSDQAEPTLEQAPTTDDDEPAQQTTTPEPEVGTGAADPE